MRAAPCGGAPSHESQGPWPPQEAEFVSSRRVIFYPSESQHFHRDGFSRAALEEGQRNADGPTGPLHAASAAPLPTLATPGGSGEGDASGLRCPPNASVPRVPTVRTTRGARGGGGGGSRSRRQRRPRP